jgi:hypothetical protein
MNPTRFNQLVKECIREIMSEGGRRICAWCGLDMGELGPDFTGTGDSHGMCGDCYQKQMAAMNLEDPTKQYSVPLSPQAKTNKSNFFPPIKEDTSANKVRLYCNKVYGQTSNPLGRDSHGICPACANKK